MTQIVFVIIEKNKIHILLIQFSFYIFIFCDIIKIIKYVIEGYLSMSVFYSLIFLGSGIIIEIFFHILEVLVIRTYSRRGVVRSKRLFRIPFEILYWAKFPVVSAILYYMVKYIPSHFNLIQIIFYFSLFAMGMYVLNEYFRDLKY